MAGTIFLTREGLPLLFLCEDGSLMTINDKVQATTPGEKLQAAVDQAGELYHAGPNTLNRKITEVDAVLSAAVEAIQEIDERLS